MWTPPFVVKEHILDVWCEHRRYMWTKLKCSSFTLNKVLFTLFDMCKQANAKVAHISGHHTCIFSYFSFSIIFVCRLWKWERISRNSSFPKLTRWNSNYSQRTTASMWVMVYSHLLSSRLDHGRMGCMVHVEPFTLHPNRDRDLNGGQGRMLYIPIFHVLKFSGGVF